MRLSSEAKIGDTLFKKGLTELEPVALLKQSKPMVFAGVYPMDQSETPALKSAIEKLTLNDASVTVAKESRYVEVNVAKKFSNSICLVLLLDKGGVLVF